MEISDMKNDDQKSEYSSRAVLAKLLIIAVLGMGLYAGMYHRGA